DRLLGLRRRKAALVIDRAAEQRGRDQRIGRVVRRLIQPHHNTRARIYDRDGRLVVGMMAEQAEQTVTLRDVANQTSVLDRKEITELQALPASLMPEGMLLGLTDSELANLFAYLRR
ncbi:MAG: hypothetical protein ABL994_13275, partial [Verrucomicrobiales bacterium]